MLLAGLFILLFATNYILFSSGLVETPRPGSLYSGFSILSAGSRSGEDRAHSPSRAHTSSFFAFRKFRADR